MAAASQEPNKSFQMSQGVYVGKTEGGGEEREKGERALSPHHNSKLVVGGFRIGGSGREAKTHSGSP